MKLVRQLIMSCLQNIFFFQSKICPWKTQCLINKLSCHEIDTDSRQKDENDNGFTLQNYMSLEVRHILNFKKDI